MVNVNKCESGMQLLSFFSSLTSSSFKVIFYLVQL